MAELISAKFEQLKEDAFAIAAGYFYSAVDVVEQKLGTGAAKANPALVTAIVQAATSEYIAVLNAKVYSSAAGDLASALNAVAGALSPPAAKK